MDRDREKSQNFLEIFSQWNEFSSWFYGLILGDGHVSNSRIHIGCEPDVIDSICSMITPNNIIKNNNKFKEIYFISRPSVKWFRNRGVERNKSASLPWPNDMSDSMKWHFLRGFFDADGCVTISKPPKGFPKARVKYSSCSIVFLKEARDFMKKNGIMSTISVEEESGFKEILNKKCFIKKNYRLEIKTRSLSVFWEKIYPKNVAFFNKRKMGITSDYQRGMANRGACSLCNKPAITSGFCRKHHYERKEKKICYAIDDGVCCRKIASRLDLCQMHYSRLIRNGHTNRVRKKKTCSEKKDSNISHLP